MSKKFIELIALVVFLCLFLTSQALAGTAQYTYDNLNRLVQVEVDPVFLDTGLGDNQ